MYRKFFLLTALGLFFFSCGEQKKYNLEEFSQEIGNSLEELSSEDESKVVSILKPLYPKDWKILKVFRVKEGIKEFNQFLVAVYSPEQHAVFYNFVWFTKDGKFLITSLYKVEETKVLAILPKKKVDYPLEDISWILEINRIIYAQNLPLILTKGQKIIYLVWNPYCKQCYEKWKNILKKAQEKNISIILIPYHSIYYPLDNIYMMVYLLWRAQREGLLTVLNDYYSKSNNFEDFIKQLKLDTYRYLKDMDKNSYNNFGYSIEAISKILERGKVFYIPTTIKVDKVDKVNSFASGYIFVNQIKLEE